MTQLSKSQLIANINSNIYDNTQELITASALNSVLQNVADSALNLITDSDLLGLSYYDESRIYSLGQSVIDGNDTLRICLEDGTTGPFDTDVWGYANVVNDTSADNGVTNQGQFQLGGNLIKDTTIQLNGYQFSLAGAGFLSLGGANTKTYSGSFSGSVAIGNNNNIGLYESGSSAVTVIGNNNSIGTKDKTNLIVIGSSITVPTSSWSTDSKGTLLMGHNYTLKAKESNLFNSGSVIIYNAAEEGNNSVTATGILLGKHSNLVDATIDESVIVGSGFVLSGSVINSTLNGLNSQVGTGSFNTVIGNNLSVSGSFNTAIGTNNILRGNLNTVLGANSALSGSISNSLVLGTSASYRNTSGSATGIVLVGNSVSVTKTGISNSLLLIPSGSNTEFVQSNETATGDLRLLPRAGVGAGISISRSTTTGSVNTSHGEVYMTSGVTSAPVSSSFCRPDSTILLTIDQSAEGDSLEHVVVKNKTSGSFTIQKGAAHTSNTGKVYWLIINNAETFVK